ncbi:MAG: CBS domain-containing protein [Nanoarchaeota archaeon]|jgi:predicted transcriptional regulator|nr:CBS domain-containing protein [Nanoarchaeota archaeon]
MFPELSLIRKKRIIAGITQKQLAGLSGVSQSMIAKTESKKIEPSYSVVRKLFGSLEGLKQKEDVRKCEDVMSDKILLIDSQKKVREASKIMHKHGISQIPVVTVKEIVGVIGENTILSMLAKDIDYDLLCKMKISDIMDVPLPMINKEFSVKNIIPIIKESEAIIVMNKGKPVGIITKSDLI